MTTRCSVIRCRCEKVQVAVRNLPTAEMQWGSNRIRKISNVSIPCVVCRHSSFDVAPVTPKGNGIVIGHSSRDYYARRRRLQDPGGMIIGARRTRRQRGKLRFYNAFWMSRDAGWPAPPSLPSRCWDNTREEEDQKCFNIVLEEEEENRWCYIR